MISPISVYLDPDHVPYRACFTIGVQSFYVCERDDKSEAEWFVQQLQTAFDKVIREYNNIVKELEIKSAEILDLKKQYEILARESREIVKNREIIIEYQEKLLLKMIQTQEETLRQIDLAAYRYVRTPLSQENGNKGSFKAGAISEHNRFAIEIVGILTALHKSEDIFKDNQFERVINLIENLKLD